MGETGLPQVAAPTDWLNPPPRMARLRRELVAAIPCWPDTAAARAELDNYDLWQLLIVYTNWIDRFLVPRKRQVRYASRFWDNPKAVAHKTAVLRIVERIESGSDLTAHLSDQIHTHGYVPKGPPEKIKGPEWGDKDFALNAYDMHHLHLGKLSNEGNRVSHGRDLLYACFERDVATFVLLGDHKSFDDGSLATAAAAWRGGGTVQTSYMAKERKDLHRHGKNTYEVVDGRLYIGSELSMDGTAKVHWINHLRGTIVAFDPYLDDPKWVSQALAQHPLGSAADAEWAYFMNGCDLLVREVKTNTLFALPNCEWRR